MIHSPEDIPRSPDPRNIQEWEVKSQFSLKYFPHRSNIYKKLWVSADLDSTKFPPSPFPTVPSQIPLRWSLNFPINVNFFEEGCNHTFSPYYCYHLTSRVPPPSSLFTLRFTQEPSFSFCYHPIGPSEFIWFFGLKFLPFHNFTFFISSFLPQNLAHRSTR